MVMVLPKKGVEVPLDELKLICLELNLEVLWQSIEEDPPSKVFKSDGCSVWPDNWGGFNLYPACFKHDLKYWCGRMFDHQGRLQADLELALDVLAITKDVKLSMMMLSGVRTGGNEIFKLRFSWGFGRT